MQAQDISKIHPIDAAKRLGITLEQLIRARNLARLEHREPTECLVRTILGWDRPGARPDWLQLAAWLRTSVHDLRRSSPEEIEHLCRARIVHLLSRDETIVVNTNGVGLLMPPETEAPPEEDA